MNNRYILLSRRIMIKNPTATFIFCRNSGTAIVHLIGNLGSFASPLVLYLVSINPLITYTVIFTALKLRRKREETTNIADVFLNFFIAPLVLCKRLQWKNVILNVPTVYHNGVNWLKFDLLFWKFRSLSTTLDHAYSSTVPYMLRVLQ